MNCIHELLPPALFPDSDAVRVVYHAERQLGTIYCYVIQDNSHMINPAAWAGDLLCDEGAIGSCSIRRNCAAIGSIVIVLIVGG